MAVTLKWNGPQYGALAGRKMDAFLKAAGAAHWRISLDMAALSKNTGTPVTRTRDTSGQGGGPVGSQYTIYPFPSKPGEPPRIRTGFGRKNIVGGYNKTLQKWRTGYTRLARYMTWHELGIRYPGGTQQRPTIIPALRDNLDRLAVIGKNAADRVQT